MQVRWHRQPLTAPARMARRTAAQISISLASDPLITSFVEAAGASSDAAACAALEAFLQLDPASSIVALQYYRHGKFEQILQALIGAFTLPSGPRWCKRSMPEIKRGGGLPRRLS